MSSHVVSYRGYETSLTCRISVLEQVQELDQNEMMLAINFRREPIYLSEEKLNAEPQYARYRYAIQKVPSLRPLRKLFIGRVVHSSFDQWKNDVRELLQFNSTASDDRRWEK